MIKRIIDVGDSAYLHLKNGQLIIDRNRNKVAQIPVEDVGILILQHPAIVITQALVVACQANNTVLVFCDSRHLPSTITFPACDANSLHSKILKEQIAVTLPRKKQIWKQIVMQKIDQQSETLKQFEKDFQSIKILSKKVRSGDKGNCEAIAAQKYWRLLFGENFRRDTNLDGVNALLNYGYAIVRAMVTRAIVGSGLHPALGLHHHNQYNGLNLADDLIEPLRPWVDRIVYRLSEQGMLEINRDTKQELLSLPNQKVLLNEKEMPLMVSCHHLMAQLKLAFQNKAVKLKYPKLL